MAATALLLVASPAAALTSLEVSIILRAAEFTYDFLSSASSNATAVADPFATSKSEGIVTKHFEDTGFFSAKVQGEISSGKGSPPPGYAVQSYSAIADYNFFSENEHIHGNAKPNLVGPDGLDGKPIENTKIKGVIGVLKEAIGIPPAPRAFASPVLGEMFIPVRLETDLGRNVEYSFSVGILSQGELVTVATGGGGGKLDPYLLLPLLSQQDPGLADLVIADYVKRVLAGRGSQIAFNVGDGLLPTGDSGEAGFSFRLPVDTEFQLMSELQTSNYGAIPEPGSWLLLLAGFGAMGVRLRGRRSRLSGPRYTAS